jgi:hypothetical protein
MRHTLPWAFDEFFHQEILHKCITKIQVFERPSQKMMTIDRSSLCILDASPDPTLAASILSLPHVALSDCIETLHLSYYNRPINIPFSALRIITLVNSINCLNNCFSFPITIRILLYYDHYPNYILPNWSIIVDSLSTFPQLSSLRVFMYMT